MSLLVYGFYFNGWDYVLLRDYKYELTHALVPNVDTPYYKIEGKLLTIKKGYSWDGATFAPDWKCIITATLVHDCLYQVLEKVGWLTRYDERKLVDEEFYHSCVENGTPKWVAWAYYQGVRLGWPIYKKLKSLM